MKPLVRTVAAAALAASLLVLGACASREEPARQAFAEAEAAVAAASGPATKYAPDRVQDLEQRLAGLRADLEAGEFGTVVEGAPALVAEAQAVAAEAAKREAEFFATIRDQWAELSRALPQAVAAIESRIAALEKMRRLPDGITREVVAEAKTSLEASRGLWGEATDAFAAGRLEEAIAKGLAVNARAEGLTTQLRMQGEPAPAAAE